MTMDKTTADTIKDLNAIVEEFTQSCANIQGFEFMYIVTQLMAEAAIRGKQEANADCQETISRMAMLASHNPILPTVEYQNGGRKN